MNKRSLGKQKENEVCDLIIKNGYKVIEQNYRNRYGEIDIIAENNDYIIFIEVKYRRNDKFGTGEESIDIKKCRKILMGSQQYITDKNITKGVRYDAAVLSTNEIRYIENYFWGDEIGF